MWNGNCERLQMNSSKVHVSKLKNLLIAAASLHSLSKIHLHFPRYVCNMIHDPEQSTHCQNQHLRYGCHKEYKIFKSLK